MAYTELSPRHGFPQEWGQRHHGGWELQKWAGATATKDALGQRGRDPSLRDSCYPRRWTTFSGSSSLPPSSSLSSSSSCWPSSELGTVNQDGCVGIRMSARKREGARTGGIGLASEVTSQIWRARKAGWWRLYFAEWYSDCWKASLSSANQF
jgi:hypothetical protein